MDANFVLVKLDVMENGDKKATYENPGGQQVMADMGGAKSGLPFYAILDKSGKKLGDSNVMPKGANIGYPGAPEEIVAFGKLLKDTAPRLTPAQLDAVTGYLKAHAPH